MTDFFSKVFALFLALFYAVSGVAQTPWCAGEDKTPDPLYAGYAEELSYGAKPVYRERITRKNGAAAIGGNVGLRIDYTSEFYGHDSLINRDFTHYGSRYEAGALIGLLPPAGELAGADLDGDGCAELLQYQLGVLSVYPVTMKNGGKQTYVPSMDLSFRVGVPKKLNVGKGMHLCGAGDFNGDGYNDVLFGVGTSALIYFGSGDGFRAREYPFDAKGFLRCGDIDGNGSAEVLCVNGSSVTAWTAGAETLEMLTREEAAADCADAANVWAADVNSDGLCDLIYLMQDGCVSRFCSFFGRGDGRFGSYEEDGDNKNLYAVFESDRKAKNIAFADVTGNGAADIIGSFTRIGIATASVLYSYDEPAYDYSLFGMHKDGAYRIYSGCRWADSNTGGDGDHVMLTTSEDGVFWKRHIEAPMFYLGNELGQQGWWADNTLEPEVVYANGVWHMYWQCSFTTPKGNYGDKIGYAASADGVHWERKTDAPAILCDDPEIGFNHEEILYVPDDPDGKPFWLYTGHFVEGAFSGYVRIRSAEPDRFLFAEHEDTSGFAQIGNQLAYFTDGEGGRVFVRITFKDVTEADGSVCARPTLFFSRDGLHFTAGDDCVLAGVDVTDERTVNNRNMYFLGLVTENGTGEIPRNEDGSFELMYLATTSKSPVAPEIFSAEAGYGVVRFTVSAQEGN